MTKIKKLKKKQMQMLASTPSVRKMGICRLNTMYPVDTVLVNPHRAERVLAFGYFARWEIVAFLKKLERLPHENFFPLGVLRYYSPEMFYTGVDVLEVGIQCNDRTSFEAHCRTVCDLLPFGVIERFHVKKLKTEYNASITLDGGKQLRLWHMPFPLSVVAATFYLSLPTEISKHITALMKLYDISISVRGVFHKGQLIDVTSENQITRLLRLPDDYLQTFFNTGEAPHKNCNNIISKGKLNHDPAPKLKPKTLNKKVKQELFLISQKRIEERKRTRAERLHNENLQKQYKKFAREQRNDSISSRSTNNIPDESIKARDKELAKKTAKVIRNLRRKNFRISGQKVPIE